MSQEKNIRLTISMPETVYNLLKEVSVRNKRSKLITEAVKLYAQELKNKALRDRLKAGYQARAERDRKIAEEWFPVEQDTYNKYVNSLEEKNSEETGN
ncbi:MAG: CopG family transcriptional regulator [Candidatus Eremiobacterota bacterium]